MDSVPYVIDETEDFAVVFKPPKMHSVPLKKKSGGTLLEWYRDICPSVVDLMHRLDYETHGLVLFAKNINSFNFFEASQERGEFVKEYSAICTTATNAAEGFPPPPNFSNFNTSKENPLIIESYFRPYGRGRKLVRPVMENKANREIAADRGGFYRTEITGIDKNIFTARIKRGFRHQIRCHLCWIGFPVLNDPLYSKPQDGTFLALRARSIVFLDPSNGGSETVRREYSIPALDKLAFSGDN